MIAFKLRTSARCRYVRLSVSRDFGLEIVAPRGFDVSRIPGIIAKKERWIKRSIEKVQWSGSPVEIPAVVDLRCIGRSFEVIAAKDPPRKRHLIDGNNSIMLYVNPWNRNAAFTLLKSWLRETSRTILLPWLERLSKEHGFVYNRVTVRFQKSRWGSCSVRGNINLNAALVFLRPELVEYLLLHELCHTAEMNHSKRFWELVARHCPDYRTLDKELKNARRLVERWVYVR